MNRFDSTFNDTDPLTQRPFSGGHPDGVWMIAILLGIPIVLAVLGVFASAVMLFFTKLTTGLITLLGVVVATVVMTLVFAPPIWLLFRRSRHALTWILGLLALFAFLLIASFTLPAESPLRSQLQFAGAIGSLLFGYFSYYLFGLRRQELLR